MGRLSVMKLPAVMSCILACAMAFQVDGAELTVAGVKHLFRTVDAGIAARKVSAVDRLLADNADISVISTFNGQMQTASPSKADYLSMLSRAWSQASDYQYRRSNQQIEIINHQAIVTADVTELLTINGMAMRTVSREMTVIERVNGKLLATAISVTSHD
jgi:hypothetical protein